MNKLTIAAMAMASTVILTAPVIGDDDLQGTNTNMDEAYEITVDEKTYGTTEDGKKFWYIYTPDESGTYDVLAINLTGDCPLMLNAFDVDGNYLLGKNKDGIEVKNSGKAESYQLELEEGVPYYACIGTKGNKDNNVDYLLLFHKEGEDTDQNVLQSEDVDESVEATNMNVAMELDLNSKTNGTAKDKKTTWYFFETGDAGEEYTVSIVDKTNGKDKLTYNLYNAYGVNLNKKDVAVDNKGAASSVNLELEPESMYYVGIWSNNTDPVDYSITVKNASGEVVESTEKNDKTEKAKSDSTESEANGDFD